MKTIAFGLILLSLGIMRTSGSLLCNEILGPAGCFVACGTFPYECTSDGRCICTAQTTLIGIPVNVECNEDDFVTATACETICVNLDLLNQGSISTSNCDDGICHCVYDL
ncbi:hypothetical protein HA402_009247 [Bradysia odoriphaga]|nr:hypothetical protein HA402_009247 [Bradysia odoriphaga]